MSHTLMAGTGGGNTTSQLMLENLTNAPAILHLGQNEESFVSSLKKKLSVRVGLFLYLLKSAMRKLAYISTEFFI